MREKLKKISDRFWTFSDKFDYDSILERNTQPFLGEIPKFLDAEINDSFTHENRRWIHTEYIKRLRRKIVIEPEYAHCITGFNIIVKSSVFHPGLTPSFPRYILHFFNRNRSFYPKVILFDGQVGTNYFHFFSDVFSKIWLIQKIEGYENLPIIIGEKTFNTKYFQRLLRQPEIKKLNWVIQKKNHYISTNELFLVKAMPYKKEYFAKVKKMLIDQDSTVSKRVFLNRSKKTGRYIENFLEIQPILKKYHFEIVDTDKTTLDYQASLFNSIHCLIGIHGAGETNIIFAKQNLRLLEINPANRISCHYYWLSKEVGIEYYDVILGGELPSTNDYPEKGFYLEPKSLDEAIARMFNHKTHNA